MKHDVVVIGGGAAGIAAARRLHEARADVLLVEASGRLGGRAHSVRVRGEVLDLGCAWLHSADRNPWTRIALAEGFQIDRTPAGLARAMARSRLPARTSATRSRPPTLNGTSAPRASPTAPTGR